MSDDFTFGTSPPIKPTVGQMYLDTDIPSLFIYDGQQWVTVKDSDLRSSGEPNVLWFPGEKYCVGKVNQPNVAQHNEWWEDNADAIVQWVRDSGGEVIIDPIGYHTIVLTSAEQLTFFKLRWGA